MLPPPAVYFPSGRSGRLRGMHQSRWILREDRVCGDDQKIMLERLTDQNAVKGISMMCFQAAKARDRWLRERQRFDSMLFALCRQPGVRRFGKWQLPEAVFDGRLPYGHDAQVHLVGIFDRAPKPWRYPRVAGDVPKKNMRIEQQPHCSKSRSTSSGSGSSKSSGTTNDPAASPNGLGRRAASMGRISATGRSSSVTMSVSPSRTRCRMPFGSCVISSTVTFTGMSLAVVPRRGQALRDQRACPQSFTFPSRM